MPEISPADAKKLADDGAQVVDVRAAEEFEAGHAPGSRHVPLETITADTSGLDRSQPLVLICRSGDRSGMAADAFAASGWDAHSVEGGLLAWAGAGLELEPEGGSVIERSGLPPR
jgi:rhodanese-related sulfurtransferase